MTKLLSSLLLFAVFFCFAQNQIKILNQKTQQPVTGAAVYCDDDLLGKTNIYGILNFKTKCKKVEIIANNFEDAVVDVKKNMEISLIPLSEKMSNIDKVIITNKSDDRALKILDEVNKREKENSPKSLESYDFKAYSKYSIDVDKDTIDIYKNFISARKDSLSKVEKKDLKMKPKEIKDSLMGEELIEATQQSQMFLWEKAAEHKFSKKFGEKTIECRGSKILFMKL